MMTGRTRCCGRKDTGFAALSVTVLLRLRAGRPVPVARAARPLPRELRQPVRRLLRAARRRAGARAVAHGAHLARVRHGRAGGQVPAAAERRRDRVHGQVPGLGRRAGRQVRAVWRRRLLGPDVLLRLLRLRRGAMGAQRTRLYSCSTYCHSVRVEARRRLPGASLPVHLRGRRAGHGARAHCTACVSVIWQQRASVSACLQQTFRATAIEPVSAAPLARDSPTRVPVAQKSGFFSQCEDANIPAGMVPWHMACEEGANCELGSTCTDASNGSGRFCVPDADQVVVDPSSGGKAKGTSKGATAGIVIGVLALLLLLAALAFCAPPALSRFQPRPLPRRPRAS